MLISPSILSVYSNGLDRALKELEQVNSDYVHVDVMDNKFVPNYTFNHEFVKELKNKTNLLLDTHIMIENPDEEYLKYIEAGSNILTFHFEATSNPKELLNKIKTSGVKAGISIKPNTPVEVLLPFIEDIDVILIMSVEPGFGGQKFIENSLDKIKYLDELRKQNNYNYVIEVDGGINNINTPLVKEAGCDIIVVGSYLMNSESISKTYLELKEK